MLHKFDFIIYCFMNCFFFLKYLFKFAISDRHEIIYIHTI